MTVVSPMTVASSSVTSSPSAPQHGNATPRKAPPQPPRSTFNRFVLVSYMALGVVIPSLLIVWATTLASIPGAAAARILLFFLVLPCFFAYIGIVTARFFPRSALGSVKFFLPLAINLALYGLSFASFEEFALYYVLSSLPLFLGFTLLLLAGLSFLILANMSLSVVREAIISFVIVVLGTLPVLYTALLGYELHVRDVAGDVARWRVVASYVSSTVLVFYLHLAPMRTLYREGKL